ncbi:MAG: hypothetical protein HYZ26_13210 [Chloroflexi bacterium]|nr:hypothetical protein [Chloroflexota bacterium]
MTPSRPAPPGWLVDALEFARAMRIGPAITGYRLHAKTGATPFASLFALFIFHLVGETRAWDAGTRQNWIDHVQRLQDPASGLFRDPAHRQRATDEAHSADHLDQQLTGYCLSALRLLGARPLHPLAFIRPWYEPEHTRAWLDGLNWASASNSGNKAMFAGIMLAEEAERGADGAKAGLEAWFEWHDAHADPRSGYWGRGRASRYWEGMQGYVHPLVVYEHCGRAQPALEKAARRTLLLQQPDGLFSPKGGGGACDDLDALHILAAAHRRFPALRLGIEQAMAQARHGLLDNQNPDGGFCWAQRPRFGLRGWWGVARHNLDWRHPDKAYVALRAALAGQMKLNRRIETGWSDDGRAWDQSSLWDTWFRLLALVEIELILSPDDLSARWQSIPAPNFGRLAGAG